MGSSRQSVNSPESGQLSSRKRSTRQEVVNLAAENGQLARDGVCNIKWTAEVCNMKRTGVCNIKWTAAVCNIKQTGVCNI